MSVSALKSTDRDYGETDNPEEVMRGLNKQVVYFRPNDDITNHIVKYLNTNYQRNAAAPAATETPAAPARQ